MHFWSDRSCSQSSVSSTTSQDDNDGVRHKLNVTHIDDVVAHLKYVTEQHFQKCQLQTNVSVMRPIKCSQLKFCRICDCKTLVCIHEESQTGKTMSRGVNVSHSQRSAVMK